MDIHFNYNSSNSIHPIIMFTVVSGGYATTNISFQPKEKNH